MKKAIALLVFVLTCHVGLSQTIFWSFNDTNNGWTGTNFTVTNESKAVKLTSTGTNPTFSIGDASVGTLDFFVIAVTLKVSAGGPTLINFGFAKNETSAVNYINRPIYNNNSEFVTYYIYPPEEKWKGTMNKLILEFKENDGSVGGADFTNNGATIEIDKIEVFDLLEVKKDVFDFNLNYDTDEWLPENATVSGPVDGVLTFTPQAGKNSTLYTSGAYYIVQSGNRSFLNVKIKNETTDVDKLRVRIGFNKQFISTPITTSDSEYKTYSLDVTQLDEWKATVFLTDISFVNSTTDLSTDTGNILIDEISFSAERLSVNDYDRIDSAVTVYPNPVNNTLNIDAAIAISNVEIFDITGQLQITTNTSNINVQALSSGTYIIKIYGEESLAVKRFVKE